jgi:hypothetical protein
MDPSAAAPGTDFLIRRCVREIAPPLQLSRSGVTNMFRIAAVLVLTLTVDSALGSGRLATQDFPPEDPCSVIYVECPDNVSDSNSDDHGAAERM